MAKNKNEQLDDLYGLSDLSGELQKQLELEIKNTTNVSKRVKLLRELNTLTFEHNKISTAIYDVNKKIVDNTEYLVEQGDKYVNNIKKLAEGYGKINQKNTKLVELEKQQSDLNAELLATERNLSLSVEQRAAKLKEHRDAQKTINDQVEEHAKKLKQINDEADNFTESLLSQVKSIPLIGNAFAKHIEGPLKELVTKKLAKPFSGMEDSVTNITDKMSPKWMGALAAGVALVAIGFKQMMAYSEEVAQSARMLNLTSDQTRDVLADQSAVLAKTAVTGKGLATSTEELRAASVQLLKIGGQRLATDVQLASEVVTMQKAYGLTEEHIGQIVTLSKITGKSTEELRGDVIAITKGFEQQTGYAGDINEIMQDVTSVSGNLRANFKGNVKELTFMAVKARALGLELKTIEQIQNNLLNVEESMSAEVEAQLVTGMKLNLAKAREYALTGDMSGLMSEIQKQGVTLTKFQDMNIIQRQSLAKAMGMEVDQMQSMLEKQEIYKQIGVDLDKASGEELAKGEKKLKQLALSGDEAAKKLMADKEQASIQERMTASMEALTSVMKVMAIAATAIGIGLISAAIAATLGAATPLIIGGIAAATGALLISGLATGGTVMEGGSVMVGESGPEILDLPKGAKVTSNKDIGVDRRSSADSMVRIEKLLETLIQKVEQPAIVKIGDKVITEIDSKIRFTRNMKVGVGNSHGQFQY